MSHSISLSRSAALCGGCLPLELLARKLARLGEASALLALVRLPLPMSARVRWTLYGTSLFLEADGSHAACGVLSEQGGCGRACLAAHPSRRREWSKEV